MKAYYNDVDPYCCKWLSNLMDAGLITPGRIDDRSIVNVRPDDVRGYERVHLFAGIAGFELALQQAGWGDQIVWTGSAPCQPFSVAGKGLGERDPRHLWPHYFRLVQACRPPCLMGEQVSGAAGYRWFDGVAADLESEGYTCRAVDIPAAAINAPHIRQRLYWVADTAQQPQRESNYAQCSESWQDARPDVGGCCGGSCGLGDPKHAQRWQDSARGNDIDGAQAGWDQGAGLLGASSENPWADYCLIRPDAAGKWRRIKPGIAPLAHGVPARVGKLRSYGNAIIPQLAAEVIKAYMEATHAR